MGGELTPRLEAWQWPRTKVTKREDTQKKQLNNNGPKARSPFLDSAEPEVMVLPQGRGRSLFLPSKS